MGPEDLCVHCGGELFNSSDDQRWTCENCSCVWNAAGELIQRGPECPALRETLPGELRSLVERFAEEGDQD